MTFVEELTAEIETHDLEQGWTREEVTLIPELRDPDLLAPFKRAYLSEKSVSVIDTRHRKVLGQRIARGEIARRYLDLVMVSATEDSPKSLLKKRVPYRKDAMQFMDRRPAYYFAGETGGPFALVDITACYATLYSRLTLDLTYRPDTDPPMFGLGRGTFPRAEEWIENKGPRNALFGSLIRPTVREWRHGAPVDNAFPNKYFAPDLFGIVFDTCHAIAADAIKDFGALSWAVDGGVFRPEEANRFIEHLRSSFGLEAEIRAEGPGWLFSPVSYSIGPKTTVDVEKGKAHEWPASNQIRRSSSLRRGWLGSIFAERAT